MTEFISGLTLSRLFYQEAVRPVLRKHFPKLIYSAGLIGHGSEVLGYDTSRSIDHHWGPQLQVFISEINHPIYAGQIKHVLGNELPREFMGYSTNFGDPDSEGVQLLQAKEAGPVNHRVTALVARSFFKHLLSFDPYEDIGMLNWLTFPQQELLCLTQGEVFFDGLGELSLLRDKFRYYPKDVWLFLISCQWKRVSQQEAFMGRCGEVGDELGSRIVATTIIKDLMILCFLFEKTYFPYSKWFGTAFSRLKCSGDLIPIFVRILDSSTWQERESWLSQAYVIIGNFHNSLGITRHIESCVSPYFTRPYLVIHANRFSDATIAVIQDSTLKNIETRIGSVDQFIENVDFLSSPRLVGKTSIFFQK
jgi:hypothetical protein